MKNKKIDEIQLCLKFKNIYKIWFLLKILKKCIIIDSGKKLIKVNDFEKNLL